MVNFINTAPLYEVWRRTVKQPNWRVVEDTPAVLNRLLFKGELDLGFISAHEYAAHPDTYRILDDLSISATGSVGSVFLFSQVPFDQLSERFIRLSPQSQTSNSLVKILLEDFNGIKPFYQDDPKYFMAGVAESAGVVSIGDEALRLSSEKRYPYRYDLGHLWQEQTGLPFVFAIWAVREEFCRKSPDTVVQIHHELLRCVREGKAELVSISKQVAPRIPMNSDICLRYLQGLEYDLDETKRKALERYFTFLIQRGEGAPSALPLKICG
ncbi:MAG: menaquinone biosynthesis protein [Proteobacteria bacterium]|nr:menaquinone biosynthesis protein [Pseudomonadota bacterium]MBU1686544.1 menaquinone biosynthesis protein [Pseudomonadota bacterium]